MLEEEARTTSAAVLPALMKNEEVLKASITVATAPQPLAMISGDLQVLICPERAAFF